MKTTTKLISESEYQTILKRIDVLMDAQKGTPELEELIRLTRIAERYEDEHYPIGVPP
ncbi:conserved hypothetical protein [Desulfosarcina cetonica]|nr:conserved hypothetical protein [Desulfosarcina cetonica]